MSKKLIAATLSVFFGFSGALHAFTIEFNWDGLKICNTGRPNLVANPEFKVKGLPKGTNVVEFRLVDKDAPSFNHGGGTVMLSEDGVVSRGAFKYKSPCPPNGQHTYEWTATAKDKKGFGGNKLGVAKSSRKYPE